MRLETSTWGLHRWWSLQEEYAERINVPAANGAATVRTTSFSCSNGTLRLPQDYGTLSCPELVINQKMVLELQCYNGRV